MEDFFGAVLGIILVILVVALLMALPMMWIVNYLFSDTATIAVFGTATIGFWKALWLNFFCGIAFKSSSSSKKN